MKHKNDQDVQINMLCQIPGISIATANALIKEFGSMNCLMNVMNDSIENMENFKVNDRKINKNAVSNLKKHLLAL